MRLERPRLFEQRADALEIRFDIGPRRRAAIVMRRCAIRASGCAAIAGVGVAVAVGGAIWRGSIGAFSMSIVVVRQVLLTSSPRQAYLALVITE